MRSFAVITDKILVINSGSVAMVVLHIRYFNLIFPLQICKCFKLFPQFFLNAATSLRENKEGKLIFEKVKVPIQFGIESDDSTPPSKTGWTSTETSNHTHSQAPMTIASAEEEV
jgi:hypothetical protein